MLGEGWGGAGRGGGVGKGSACRSRGHVGVVAATRLLPRLLLWPGLSLVLTAPGACVAGAVAVPAPAACTVALRWVSPRLVPPAWRGPFKLGGVHPEVRREVEPWEVCDVEPWSWVRGGVVGRTCAGGERERREMGLRCDRLERWWGREGECDRLELYACRVVCRRSDLSVMTGVGV